MESFGLFNLLKSLLPQTENLPKNPTDTVDNDGVNTPPPSANTQPSAPDFLDAPPNAFLDFVSRHNQRKKNIKKP